MSSSPEAAIRKSHCTLQIHLCFGCPRVSVHFLCQRSAGSFCGKEEIECTNACGILLQRRPLASIPCHNSLACPRVLQTIIHHDRLFPKQMGKQPTPMTRSFNLHHDKMHWPCGSCKSSSSEWPHHNHFSPQDSTAPKREGRFKHEHEPPTSPGPRGVEAAAQAPRPAEELVLLSNT